MEKIKATPFYSGECEAVRSGHSRQAIYREPTLYEHFKVAVCVRICVLAKEEIKATRLWFFLEAAGWRQKSSH